jgi:HSP20 family protein
MMSEKRKGGLAGVESTRVEILGLLREPVPGQLRVSSRQHKTWCPPTDVYETDDHVVVKVEIAGVDESNFAISLDNRLLVISGARYDPGAKVGYQQMEIVYGDFETKVRLTRAIEEERIEATYHNGFLSVRMPKAKPRQVPVVGTEERA